MQIRTYATQVTQASPPLTKLYNNAAYCYVIGGRKRQSSEGTFVRGRLKGTFGGWSQEEHFETESKRTFQKMEIIQVRRKARPTISFQYEKDGNNSNGNKGQDPSFQYSPPPHPA